MKFLVDNQLPPALARLLRDELGSEAIHVTEIGMRDASDEEIWKHANTEGLIVVSKDEDFTTMVLRPGGAGLLWVRVGNCRRIFLLDVFRRVWNRVVERLKIGDRFIEIR